MRGIIAMQDGDQRFVVQAVHMLLEGGSQRPWKSDERRDSRLVFIGRELPKERLKEEFESCRV
jgi:G3E family GTPase